VQQQALLAQRDFNMAFYIGSTNYYPGLFPVPTSTATGAPLIASISSAGALSTFWAYPGDPQATPSGTLQYRSILTHGYVAGGYKDGNPWRTVNKTWHSNDTTICCGEQLAQPAAYAGGSWSDYNAYVHGASNSFTGASVLTASYSLATGVARTQNKSGSSQEYAIGTQSLSTFGYEGNNPAGDGTSGEGTWDMTTSRTYFNATQDQIGQVGYITGGAQTAACDRLHFPSEIMYTCNGPGVNGNHCTAASGSIYSWWSIAGNNRSMNLSNQSWATWSPGGGVSLAPDGTCKALPTKLGWHYGGSGTNVTTPIMKWSDATGSTMSTTMVKPIACGEENPEMGQNWGYILGTYNGYQNNYTYKVTYTNDTISVMGTGTQPKGHAGMSSAMTSSASASVTINNT
jgi:hypothetical protein